MKKIIILVFIFSLVSCEIQYDAETKLVVQTKLIDNLGNPLSNQEIRITARSDYGFLTGSSSDLISNGKTNTQGDLLLIFPAPKSEEVFLDISINGYNYGNNSEYQEKNYYNLLRKDFNNYKLNLNPIRLFRNDEITQLTLVPNRINPDAQIRNIRIEGLQPNESIIYNNDLNQDPNNIQTQFSVLKNNSATIKYDVFSFTTNLTSSFTIQIPIVSTPVSQTINY